MAHQPSWIIHAKSFLLDQQWFYITHTCGYKEVNFCPKVNVIAGQEFELAFFDVAVWPISHENSSVSIA